VCENLWTEIDSRYKFLSMLPNRGAFLVRRSFELCHDQLRDAIYRSNEGLVKIRLFASHNTKNITRLVLVEACFKRCRALGLEQADNFIILWSNTSRGAVRLGCESPRACIFGFSQLMPAIQDFMRFYRKYASIFEP